MIRFESSISISESASPNVRKFFESIEPDTVVKITLTTGEEKSYLVEDLFMLENGDGTMDVQCNIIKEIE